MFSRLDDWRQTSYMIWCRIWWLMLPFRTLYRGLQGRVTLCSADTACFDPEAPKASCTIPCGHLVGLVKVDACSISNSLDLTHNSNLQLLVATAGLAHCLRCYMFTVAFAWNFQKPRRSLHSKGKNRLGHWTELENRVPLKVETTWRKRYSIHEAKCINDYRSWNGNLL